MTLTLFANYFTRFIDHWSTTLRTQNAVVMGAVVVGVAGVLIITFGTKKK
jgi:hypothetical protein